MTSTNWAYASNYLVYSAMVVYTLAMFSAALEVAMNVKGAKVLVTPAGEGAPQPRRRKE